MFLKYRTAQNIVIGGLAGALPPVIAWISISNEMILYPIILCLIIFLWTPPHSWALAIYRNQDYSNAEKFLCHLYPDIRVQNFYLDPNT